jgi:ribosomal protein S18 acetylase RimI-like enzyme
LPSDPIVVTDRNQIEAFTRQDPFLHLYALGDLDPFYWDQTIWYASGSGAELDALILVYTAMDPPVVQALCAPGDQALPRLLRAAVPLLPDRFQAHLTPGVEAVLEPHYHLQGVTPHLKMGLRRPLPDDLDTTRVETLREQDLGRLLELYEAAYPDNAFDPRMLETGLFRGISDDGRLVSAAGVHVHSSRYRVAALGSVATHPDYRGRGFGRAVTAALCRDLLASTDHIGLNVRADNHAAIACYRALGFEVTHEYVELVAEARPGQPG